MKVRMSAVVLILAITVWLPAMAQQSAAEQPSSQQATTPAAPTNDGKAAGTSECACCGQMKDQGKEATGDPASKACCPAKEGTTAKSATRCEDKDMARCKQDRKENKTAKNCCSGKDGKICARKEGKECCGKEALACNSKDRMNCCAGHAQNCSHGASQS